MTPPGRHVQLAYLALTVGCASFTVYGSLVPFDYDGCTWAEALERFTRVCRTEIAVASRSDWLANCLLGCPLGFGLVGLLRVRHGAGVLDWAAMLAAVVFTTLLAVAVEFCQVALPGRTSSLNDVVAQALGGSLGAVVWLIAGRPLTERVRRAWADPESGGLVGQSFVYYCFLIVVVQTLPWDIITSPGTLYRHVAHGLRSGDIVLTPFGEYARGDTLEMLQSHLELMGVFLPAGLIASRWPHGRLANARTLLAFAVVFATLTEVAQLPVSRSPSVTDVMVAVAAVMLGYAAGRSPRAWQTVALAGWGVAMAIAHWQPFALSSTPNPVIWMPLADAREQNYLGALDNILSRAMMAVPVAAYLASRGMSAPAGAVAVAGWSALLQLGQCLVVGRQPATTDVLFAAAAAYLTVTVARHLVLDTQAEGR